MNKGVGRATNTYTQKKKNSREEPESWKYEQDCGADQSLGDAQGGSGRRRKQQTNKHTHTHTDAGFVWRNKWRLWKKEEESAVIKVRMRRQGGRWREEWEVQSQRHWACVHTATLLLFCTKLKEDVLEVLLSSALFICPSGACTCTCTCTCTPTQTVTSLIPASRLEQWWSPTSLKDVVTLCCTFNTRTKKWLQKWQQMVHTP